MCLLGNEDDLVISDDGEIFFFIINNGGCNGLFGGLVLMSIKWDGIDEKMMVFGVWVLCMWLGLEGKLLYVLKLGGSFVIIKIDGKKLEG